MNAFAKLRQLTARLATSAVAQTNPTGTRGAEWIGFGSDIGYETNPDLSGINRFHTFRKMRRRVPIVNAYWDLVVSIASKATFSVEDMEGDERLDMVLSMMEGRTMADVQATMVESLLVGYSLQEIILGQMGGLWHVRAINRIPQVTIQRANLDRLQQVNSFTQFTPQTVELPREKCLYVTSGNGAFGEGVLANIADLALKYINRQELVDGARGARSANLRNIPDIAMPQEAADDDDNGFLRTARRVLAGKDSISNPRFIRPSNSQFGRDGQAGERLVAAPQYAFERPPPVPIEDNDGQLDLLRQMAIALNAETLVLGMDGTGSLALSQTQLSTLLQVIDGVMARAAQEYERLLGALWRLNGWTDEPKIVVDRSGWLDQRGAAEVLAMLKDVPGDIYGTAIDEVLEQAGLSPRDVAGERDVELDMPTGEQENDDDD